MGISDRQRKRTRDKAAQMSERRLEAESVREAGLIDEIRGPVFFFVLPACLPVILCLVCK